MSVWGKKVFLALSNKLYKRNIRPYKSTILDQALGSVDIDLVVPLFAQYRWGRWKSGRIDIAAKQNSQIQANKILGLT